ncbi:MAG: DoxX family protein [Acidimicrobiia bacterium]
MPDTINAALLILRVGLGIVFLAHGVKHALGRQKTTKWFKWLGFKAPGFQWFASTTTEIAVGVLLIAGFLTGFAAAGVVGVMFVAFWTVHRHAGFFITAFMKEDVDVEGWEYVAFLSVAAAALAIGGPGAWSVDHQLIVDATSVADLLDGRIGALLLGGGVVVAAIQLAVFWRPTRPS